MWIALLKTQKGETTSRYRQSPCADTPPEATAPVMTFDIALKFCFLTSPCGTRPKSILPEPLQHTEAAEGVLLHGLYLAVPRGHNALLKFGIGIHKITPHYRYTIKIALGHYALLTFGPAIHSKKSSTF